MSLTPIADLEGLHRHLHAAMQLEHATIPPYLTALYSIRSGTNHAAQQIIRAVAVEEMLHLTLVANVLNAVGGRPDMTAADFVPRYPAMLPDGETDFAVDCERFSRSAIETFLKIERPARIEEGSPKMVTRSPHENALLAAHVGGSEEEHFYSIGEFYRAIGQGLERLNDEMGHDRLFTGDPARQIGPEYYYSGGGDLMVVTDLPSALAALELIAEQGEGITGHVYEEDDEIPHYYRFQQLVLGRYYETGDRIGEPSGDPVDVDWDAVHPVRTNLRRGDLPEGSAVREAVARFDASYAAFLAFLTRAMNGEPELFIEAVGNMFRIKEQFAQLVRMPVGGGDTAAPSFDMTEERALA